MARGSIKFWQSFRGQSVAQSVAFEKSFDAFKRLYLFHHDPRRSDEALSRIVGEARELVSAARSSLIVEAAREGCKVPLG